MILIPLFKGLSDPVRLRITHLLTQQEELCVCHITQALQLPQSTVSRHLNTLKQCGIVVAQRRGTWIYYQLAASNDLNTLSNLLKHSALRDSQLQEDLSHLKTNTC